MADDETQGRGLYGFRGGGGGGGGGPGGFIKRTTIHCYTQNRKALGLVVSQKIFFFMDPRGTVGRIYKKGPLYIA